MHYIQRFALRTDTCNKQQLQTSTFLSLLTKNSTWGSTSVSSLPPVGPALAACSCLSSAVAASVSPSASARIERNAGIFMVCFLSLVLCFWWMCREGGCCDASTVPESRFNVKPELHFEWQCQRLSCRRCRRPWA